MREFYSITELTREFDITTRTLRFYEDQGLIQPLRRGRTRLFHPSDRQLLRQILGAKRLGFSLAEIRDLVAMTAEVPGETDKIRALLRRIGATRDLLRQKRRDLEDVLDDLDHAEEACVERLVELGVST